MKNRLHIAFGSAVVASLLLSSCSSSPEETPPGESMALKDDCTPVVVGTSSEKVNLMEELGEAFKESPEGKSLSNCATVYAINVPSGVGAEIISSTPDSWPLEDKNFWPSIWSPASTIWTDRVAAVGADSYLSDVASFTQTPVVFGVPESMAEALNYPSDPLSIKEIEELVSAEDGWGSVGKPLWGSFKLAKTNPNTSTTGLSSILMQSYAASGKGKNLTPADVAAAEDFNRTFESGAIHYGDTTGKVLMTLDEKGRSGDTGSAYVSAVALEETSLFNYNKGNPDSHTVQPGETLTPPAEKLVAVYPEEGSLLSDNPAAGLNAPWVTGEKKEASAAFLKFLQTSPAQEILPKYGFRPVDSSVEVDQYLNSDVGIDPSMPSKILPKPEATTVSAAIDQWTVVRKPSAVLELIDISGSMDEPAGDGRTKLEGAIEGARSTLDNFRATDRIGVWAFTTGLKTDVGTNVAPVRDYEELGGDGEALKNSIADLQNANKQGTPLYDAIDQAYDFMLPQAEEGRINAIVILSDGEDTDSTTSLESLLVKINGSAKEGATDAPVRIFTIAYGEGADTEILERISQASGGQMFDATDPTRIDEIFAQVMNNF